MNTPNDTTINKTIAEYMGEGFCEEMQMLKAGRVGTSIDPSAYYLKEPYTKSLDALVLVVEKLGPEGFQIKATLMKGKYEAIINFFENPISAISESPSKALSLACYAVIKEQDEKRNA